MSAPGTSQNIVDRVVQTEYAVTSEYSLLVNDPLDGIYVVPNASDPLVWSGLIFLRRSIYQGGIFRFTVTLPDEFPETTELPKIHFDIYIFHPSIDPETHEMDLGKYFPSGWKQGTHHVYHALAVMQRAFYKIDSLNKVNPDAQKLYETDRASFRRKAEKSVSDSRHKVYDKHEEDDAHIIRFSAWNPEVHDGMRVRISASGKVTPTPSSSRETPGSSWVNADMFTILGADRK